MRLLLSITVALALASCGGGGGKVSKPGGKKKPSKAVKEAVEPKMEDDPAAIALRSLAAVEGSASFEDRVPLISLAFKEHLFTLSMEDRARVLGVAGDKEASKVAGRVRTILGRRSMLRAVEVPKKGDDPLADAEKLAQSLFAASYEAVQAYSDAEGFRAWLAANWERRVRPGAGELIVETIRDVGARKYVYISLARKRIALLFEPAPVGMAYLFGGRLDQLSDYMTGPQRSVLYDLAKPEKRENDAKMDVESIVAGLMAFRRDVGRYPTQEEGLEALLAEPKLQPVQNWNGPYKAPRYDPWGRIYGYRNPSRKDPDFVDAWSQGPDGRSDTGDDIGSWE